MHSLLNIFCVRYNSKLKIEKKKRKRVWTEKWKVLIHPLLFLLAGQRQWAEATWDVVCWRCPTKIYVSEKAMGKGIKKSMYKVAATPPSSSSSFCCCRWTYVGWMEYMNNLSSVPRLFVVSSILYIFLGKILMARET